MSVFEKWSTAAAERNAEKMSACLHEEYTFVRHQSGTTLNKAEMSAMLQGLMGSTEVVIHSQRCLYENAEVMVEQSIMDFADGSREAVLSFNQLRDGLPIPNRDRSHAARPIRGLSSHTPFGLTGSCFHESGEPTDPCRIDLPGAF